jgi:hypothetical protein
MTAPTSQPFVESVLDRRLWATREDLRSAIIA